MYHLKHAFSFIPALSIQSFCLSKSSIPVIRVNDGFINSADLLELPCIKNQRADMVTLKLLASDGQQINMTLIDTLGQANGCMEYGRVIESKTRQQTVICGGRQRESWLMLSNANIIELQLKKQPAAKYLLKVEGEICQRHFDFILINEPCMQGKERSVQTSNLTVALMYKKLFHELSFHLVRLV